MENEGTVEVRITQSEVFPAYDFQETSQYHNKVTGVEVPATVVAEWKKVIEAYDRVQTELERYYRRMR